MLDDTGTLKYSGYAFSCYNLNAPIGYYWDGIAEIPLASRWYRCEEQFRGSAWIEQESRLE